MRNKTIAGLLAIFIGGLGIHKFYLGKYIQGIIYLLFMWTWMPMIVSCIEAIIFFCMSEEDFNLAYNSTVGG